MTDKFILMDLNDASSKKVAQVLGNKTSKKILDYLGEVEEASEKDISNALNMKINTVEYNLKKLISAGFVEKSKNFFWSKKGRRIKMFKLAKKHIVITPKKEKINPILLKNIFPAIVGIMAIAIIALFAIQPTTKFSEDGLNNFNSLNEIEKFIEENTIKSETLDYVKGIAKTFTSGGPAIMESSLAADSSGGATDYSSTNIQVEGVEEADIIKNDGKYIYTISANKLVIVEAYPAENMKILSELEFKDNPIEMFVNEDKLIIFFSEYSKGYPEIACMAIGCPRPGYEESKVKISIYDIKDRSAPEVMDNFSISGNYFSSRMIEDYVYIISNQYIYEDIVVPYLEKNGKVTPMEAKEMYYAPIKDHSFQNTVIASINLDNSKLEAKSVLTGRTQNIFVSKENIYTTFTKYSNWYEEMVNPEETLIQKIKIDEGGIIPMDTGSVPGHILNQFSMDEFEDNFRIATTVGNMFDEENPSTNNVYILDSKMNTIGKLEDLAPGEKIYSVRFMGKRAYIVTFKKVDPLFVIDLKNPKNPKVLGKLKIPGYSDYLHPYDENHIIGIGKDTVEASSEEFGGRNFAWYQGIKMAIFDVSDVENPIEMHKVIIGDRGTDSDALHNHKAFLFDREKELLVLPITLAKIQGEPERDNSYGEQVFQGSFVFDINLEDGFSERGRITHYTDEDILKMGNYFYGNKNIHRNLYMDNVLYSISNGMIKANSLTNLDEISLVEIEVENNYPRYYY